MDIQTRKLEFIEEFLKVNNEQLITRLEKLLQSEESMSGNQLQPLSMEELDERIDQSLDDSKNGRLTKSSNLMDEIQGWN